jgi:hypothetical protein
MGKAVFKKYRQRGIVATGEVVFELIPLNRIILRSETRNTPSHCWHDGEAWSEDKGLVNIMVFHNSKLRKV